MSRFVAIPIITEEILTSERVLMKAFRLLFIFALFFPTLQAAKAQDGLKIFISIDMEGLTGGEGGRRY